ncbi:MAG: toxin-activating lysine-acyltransferase [Hyphomicrobiaceae bacterium]
MMTDQDASSETGNETMLSEEQMNKARDVAKQAAAAFGEVTALMMRTQPYADMPLKNLSWLVGPAITTGQFALAEARDKKSGNTVPVGAVLWAMVSEEIEQKLTAATKETDRLEIDDWQSGNVPWIVAAVGDSKVVSTLLERLAKSAFKNEPARIRGRDEDGNMTVGKLRIKPKEGENGNSSSS